MGAFLIGLTIFQRSLLGSRFNVFYGLSPYALIEIRPFSTCVARSRETRV